MSEEWREDIKPGYRTRTFKHGNCTITVHRPILTDEERIKREEEIKRALAEFGRAMYRAELERAAKAAEGSKSNEK